MKRNQCNVIFSNNEEITLDIDIVLEFQLSSGMVISEDIFNKIITRQNTINANKTAYNYASYKPRTESEVRRKLMEKDFSETEIQTAILQLYKFNLLNDDKYITMFVESFLLKQSAGYKKIYVELIKRGIDQEKAESFLINYFDNTDVLSLAKKAANKKINQISYKPKEKQKRAVNDYLIRQGFDYNIVNQVISELFSSENI